MVSESKDNTIEIAHGSINNLLETYHRAVAAVFRSKIEVLG